MANDAAIAANEAIVAKLEAELANFKASSVSYRKLLEKGRDLQAQIALAYAENMRDQQETLERQQQKLEGPIGITQ